jgi:surfeit locus 1 family protein
VRVLALVLGCVAAIVCARLGLWQLDRHAQRRAFNAEVERQLEAPPLSLATGVTGVTPSALAYRRARATGVFVFSDQTTQPGRSLRGAPGVYVLTPLRFDDGTGVMVNRGWTYAPDARRADLSRFAEPAETTVEGVLLPPAGPGAVRPESLAVGYPLLPMILRRSEGGATQPAGLVPVPLPPLDAGPHLSYAVQWFAFAVIGVVGGVVLAVRSRRARSRPA